MMTRITTTIALIAVVGAAPVQAGGFQPWVRDGVVAEKAATGSSVSEPLATSYYSGGLPKIKEAASGSTSGLVIQPWYKTGQR